MKKRAILMIIISALVCGITACNSAHDNELLSTDTSISRYIDIERGDNTFTLNATVSVSDEMDILFVETNKIQKLNIEYVLEKESGDVKITHTSPAGDEATIIDSSESSAGSIRLTLEEGMNILSIGNGKGARGIKSQLTITLTGSNYDDQQIKFLDFSSPSQNL